MLLEANQIGDGASGRNGGFCAASLTHGLANGHERFADELPTLLRMGRETLAAIEAAVHRHGIGCDFERSGELDVAVADWQVEGWPRSTGWPEAWAWTGSCSTMTGSRPRWPRRPTWRESTTGKGWP